MMKFSALKAQQHLRDLIQLPRLCDDGIVWIESDRIAMTKEPLIICGLWLSEEPDAGNILTSRSKSGLSTLIVPRFKAGDLAGVLNAPASIEITPSDFSSILWEDQTLFNISGVSYFKTSLHAGRLAIAKNLGTTLFYYRSHAAAGPILCCSAAVTGKPIGVKIKEQELLLGQIFSKIKSLEPTLIQEKTDKGATLSEIEDLSADNSIDGFLSRTGEQGAALILALIACNGTHETHVPDITAAAKEMLGIVLSEKEAIKNVKSLPKAPREEMEAALVRFGWGAFIRRLESQKKSREEE